MIKHHTADTQSAGVVAWRYRGPSGGPWCLTGDPAMAGSLRRAGSTVVALRVIGGTGESAANDTEWRERHEHCMCGTLMKDHDMVDLDHSPVSMHDYELEQTQETLELAEKKIHELEARLGDPDGTIAHADTIMATYAPPTWAVNDAGNRSNEDARVPQTDSTSGVAGRSAAGGDTGADGSGADVGRGDAAADGDSSGVPEVEPQTVGRSVPLGRAGPWTAGRGASTAVAVVDTEEARRNLTTMTETLRRLEGLVASLVSWRTTTDARLDRMVANLNGTQCEMEVRLGQLEREPSRDLMGRPQ